MTRIDLLLTNGNSQTPVMNDVRDITIARNGVAALVSYENKVSKSHLLFRSLVNLRCLGSSSTMAGGDGPRPR